MKKKKTFHLSPRQAMKTAEMHIKRSKLFFEKGPAEPLMLFPLYSPGAGNEIAFYEVKIAGSDNPDAGYIIIRANDDDVPIPEFATSGKTYTERLRNKTSDPLDKVIYCGPTIAQAVDKNGKTLMSIGPEIIPLKNEEGPPTVTMKGLEEKRKTQKLKDRVKRCEKQWLQIRQFLGDPAAGNQKTDDKTRKSYGFSATGGWADGISGPADIDYDNYNWRQVTGWRRIPLLRQIPPNRPPNDQNFKSGCAAAAWAGLIAWHDLNWDPDLIYGDGHSQCDNDYMERLMMVLSKKMKTHNRDGLGYVDSNDVTKGFNVIKEYLLHGINQEIAWFIWSSAIYFGLDVPEMLQWAFEMMYLNDCPTVVGYRTGQTTGHYALGMGVALNKFFAWETPPTQDDLGEVDWSVRWGYVQVNPGSDFEPCWIDIGYVYGLWCLHKGYFGWGCPRKKVLGYSSFYSMDMASIQDKIITCWRGNNGKVNISLASQSGIPHPQKGTNPVGVDFSNRIELDEFSPAGAVSVCTWELVEKAPGGKRGFFSEEGLFIEIANGAPGNLAAQKYSVVYSATPYLFLTWRDYQGFVHIAFTSILALEKKSCAHVVLPERFKTSIDPAIAIAKKDLTGPMLYVAYAGSAPESRQGTLLIVELEVLFEFVRDGIDRWPRVQGENDAREQTQPSGLSLGNSSLTTVIHFEKAWFPFTLSDTLHVQMCASGGVVDLVWADKASQWQSEKGLINFKSSYTFKGHWGDRRVKPAPDMYRTGFGDFSTLTNCRPDVLRAGTESYIVWNDLDTSKIILTQVKDGYACEVTIISGYLLETSSSGPAIHYVYDTMSNRNIILGWFGTDPNRSMNHRLVYCSKGMISNVDDLPK